MNGKVTFVVSVVLACAVIGTAAEVEWTGKGADDLWSTAGNWEGGKAPGASDVIVLSSPPERGPVIDSDVICGEIRGPAWSGDRQSVDVVDGANVKIGGWWRFAERGACVGTINILGGNVTIDGVLRCSNGSRAHGIINVVDGVVRADGMWLSDTGGGEMNVSGNSLVDFVNNLSFGGNRGKKPMIINMNGGMIRVGRELRCPHNSARAGMAAINLAGGIIDCASFSHADSAYSMDITEGELRIKGDVTAEMKEDIGSGYIKAFGGKGSVLCKYDAARDRTIVMAAGRKSAWNPNPGNRGEQVRPDAMLKWNPGKDAQTYNIYLGTTLAAVASGAKAYRKGEKVPEIQPGLKFNQTYYWRVDTVDKAGVIAGGTVWQLTTTDGKTAAPNPQDDAIAVGVDAILAWRGGLVAASHNVYLGTNRDRVKTATKPAIGKSTKEGFKPEKLELGQTYYWRVDAVNSKWSESPWKGDVWSFTADEGKAENPRPVNKGFWTPTNVTLSWDGARTAVSHNVYFGENTRGLKLVSSGQRETTYAPSPLKEATTYFWQVEEVHPSGQKIKGDIWQFSTEGLLDLKVDLAVPQWNDRSKYREGTAKKGWFIWASSRWADMYMHDAGWLP
ncbi:MAG: fibronectin type III domain-containing protein, partial [Planctomycetota bacterium]